MHVNLSVKMDKLLLNEKFPTDGVRLSVEPRSFISYNINILYIKHSSFPRHFLRISKFSPRRIPKSTLGELATLHYLESFNVVRMCKNK